MALKATREQSPAMGAKRGSEARGIRMIHSIAAGIAVLAASARLGHAATYENVGSGSCMFEKKFDYSGFDLAGKWFGPSGTEYTSGQNADSHRVCGEGCVLNSQCSHFTYIFGMCWYKTSDAGRQKTNRQAVSGHCVAKKASGTEPPATTKPVGTPPKEHTTCAMAGVPGWTKHGRACYMYVPELKDFDAAQEVCESLAGNAYLASVASAEELKFLGALQANSGYKTHATWLGGWSTGTPAKATWAWLDGTPWDNSVAAWDAAAGEPNYFLSTGDITSTGTCTTTLKRSNPRDDLTWNDADCREQRRFFCKLHVEVPETVDATTQQKNSNNPNATDASKASESPGSPEGPATTVVIPTTPLDWTLPCDAMGLPGSWSQYDLACYLYVPELATFAEAEASCQGMFDGAHIASVNSVEENKFLARLQDNTGLKTHAAWLGGMSQDTRVQPHLQWSWVDGLNFQQPVHQLWANGEPNFVPLGDGFVDTATCISTQARGRGETMQWNDANCQSNRRYFCKVPLPLTSTTTTFTSTSISSSTTTSASSSTTVSTKTSTPSSSTTITSTSSTLSTSTSTLTESSVSTSTSTSSTTTLPPRTCADVGLFAWLRHHGSCYYYESKSPTSFVNAEERCASKVPGAHLASVHSPDENDFLMEVEDAAQSRLRDIWIGGTYDYKTAKFKWTDGSIFDLGPWLYGDVFRNPFADGEPSDGLKEKITPENCISTTTRKSRKQGHLWNDAICSFKKRYICKVSHASLVESTTTTVTATTTTTTVTLSTSSTTTSTSSNTKTTSTSLCDLASVLSVVTQHEPCTMLVTELASLFTRGSSLVSTAAQCLCYNALPEQTVAEIKQDCYLTKNFNTSAPLAQTVDQCALDAKLAGTPCSLPGLGAWTQFGDACYSYTPSSTSYAGAESACMGHHNSTLALVRSAEERAFLGNLQLKGSAGVLSSWLGEFDIESSGSGMESGIACPSSDGLIPCDSSRPFFCQARIPAAVHTTTATTTTMTATTTTRTTVPAVITDCSQVYLEGWELFDNACYYYPNKELPFKTAVESCRIFGIKSTSDDYLSADITSVTSRHEMDFVDSVTKAKHSKPMQIWLGARIKTPNTAHKNNFRWLDGRDFGSSYLPFAENEPSNGDNNLPEECLVTAPRKMFRYGVEWADVFCNRPQRFVCKIDITHAWSVFLTTSTTETTTTTSQTTTTATTITVTTTTTTTTTRTSIAETSTVDTFTTPTMETPGVLIRAPSLNLNGTTCKEIPCARLCIDDCGWSRSKGVCLQGGKTSESEKNINLDLCPLEGGVEAPLVCGDISCARMCRGECGWSKTKDACVRGGKTSASELPINAHLCPDAPVEKTCGDTRCPRLCQGECGWSRSKDACVKGGKTSASELAINAESCPTTGDEPTAAPDMCTGIVCGRLCKGECGWSKGANGCIRGGKTTVSEARINAELCPEAGVTETEGAVDSAKLEQDFLKQECNRVKCADFCVGPCGWSTGSMSCKLGANTALSELGLGQC